MKSLSQPQAESIALQALGFLGADRDRLERFLALSGLDVEALRAAARQPGFLVGVLDHFAADERLLLSFSEDAAIDPARVVEARTTLAGPETYEDP